MYACIYTTPPMYAVATAQNRAEQKQGRGSGYVQLNMYILKYIYIHIFKCIYVYIYSNLHMCMYVCM